MKHYSHQLLNNFGEEESFECRCGAMKVTTRNDELKRAAIHM